MDKLARILILSGQIAYLYVRMAGMYVYFYAYWVYCWLRIGVRFLDLAGVFLRVGFMCLMFAIVYPDVVYEHCRNYIQKRRDPH